MVDRSLIARKLVLLQETKESLARYDISSFAAFKESHMAQKAVEKSLQEMIEICMDIGKHIIADEHFGFPEEGKEIFHILQTHNMISEETTELFEKMVGFRNVIVHLYEKIDLEKVYAYWKKHLGDFDRFTSEINTSLARQKK